MLGGNQEQETILSTTEETQSVVKDLIKSLSSNDDVSVIKDISSSVCPTIDEARSKVLRDANELLKCNNTMGFFSIGCVFFKPTLNITC